MSQADRSPRSIAAGPPGRIPGPPAPPAPDDPPSESPASPPRLPSARLAWRGARRHWWQALLLWAAGSSALMALAHRSAGPGYEASSDIEVAPDLSRGRGPAADLEVFKQTQARRVAGPDVVAAALSARPDLLRLPRLAASRDPEAEVRRSVVAAVVPGTDLIRVSMTSGSPDEAAAVVDAVIEAYLAAAPEADDPGFAERLRGLREAGRERADAVRRGRQAVAELVERVGPADAGRSRDRDPAAVEQYRALTGQILQADLELAEEQARLDRLRDAAAGPPAAEAPGPDAATVAAFYAVPEVAEARARLDRARQDLTQAERAGRGEDDPAPAAARRKVEDHQAQIDLLWARMSPGLARSARPGGDREAGRQAAEARVAGLKARLSRLDGRLEGLNARARSAGADGLALEFARQDLGRAEAALDTASATLDRAELEARGPVARLRQGYRARASATPDVDRRPLAMAAAPAGMLLGVLGLLAMVEVRAARVHDPDELAARLRLRVLGVVPPLPRGRPSVGPPSARSRRDLDRFLRSLDHLRVALCADAEGRGRRGRSLIITSACVGEGKTTLAAQLAERCVNAGLLTLLVDADVRNPTLGRMFGLHESRGLVDVLGGEAAAEEAISVIGDAGGFHFLPAGSRRVDPGRLFEGDRLARLLGGARESFDVVIVDSPPVLPVPDALTVGRWVNGAVLAVRSGRSRHPLVGQARRLLASAGVPVLGAVVSGFRAPGATDYGPEGRPSHRA